MVTEEVVDGVEEEKHNNLCLSRKNEQGILIGDSIHIAVQIKSPDDTAVKLVVNAPPEMRIIRDELLTDEVKQTRMFRDQLWVADPGTMVIHKPTQCCGALVSVDGVIMVWHGVKDQQGRMQFDDLTHEYEVHL